MKKDEHDAYVGFFKELGAFLKEGVYSDRSNREPLAQLLLFESTRTEPGKFTTLDQYARADAVAEQKEILLPNRREPRIAGALAFSRGGQG